MSLQSRYGLTFGSGAHGQEVERQLREAAKLEGMTFPQWILTALKERAAQVRPQQSSKSAA
jgi:hypothetical protein